MEFTIKVTGNRIALTGVGTLFVILLILMLPNLMAQPLTRDRARTELRGHLERELTYARSAELNAAGLTVPDAAMARRWQVESNRIAGLEIHDLGTRRFLLAPPFVSSRIYIVRASLSFPGEQAVVRYYSMTVSSRINDVFWVVERPSWWWWWGR